MRLEFVWFEKLCPAVHAAWNPAQDPLGSDDNRQIAQHVAVGRGQDEKATAWCWRGLRSAAMDVEGDILDVTRPLLGPSASTSKQVNP